MNLYDVSVKRACRACINSVGVELTREAQLDQEIKNDSFTTYTLTLIPPVVSPKFAILVWQILDLRRNSFRVSPVREAPRRLLLSLLLLLLRSQVVSLALLGERDGSLKSWLLTTRFSIQFARARLTRYYSGPVRNTNWLDTICYRQVRYYYILLHKISLYKTTLYQIIVWCKTIILLLYSAFLL